MNITDKLSILIYLIVIIILITFAALFGKDAISKYFAKNYEVGVVDYVDPDTNVHYLRDRTYGGMTVRYNSDGTIMIERVKND